MTGNTGALALYRPSLCAYGKLPEQRYSAGELALVHIPVHIAALTWR